MADRKISDLTALTTPASGDYLPIVDISEAAAASKNKRITVEELMRGAPNGTAAAPSIAFESDPNTGIYSPGADQLAISTNGTGRLFVNASGNVGVGTSSPQAPLHVIGTEGLRVESAASTEGFIRFVNTSGSISIGMGGAVGNNLLIYDRTNNQTVYNYAAGVSGFHIWSVNNTERMRLDSSGRLGLGTSSPSSLLHLADAGNITVGTTTGTKIGTATTQKIGFFDKTPVVQPTAVADATDAATVITQLNALLTRMRNLGLIAT
jgi:hypothetical protein